MFKLTRIEISSFPNFFVSISPLLSTVLHVHAVVVFIFVSFDLGGMR
jgi:hypothetical protein